MTYEQELEAIKYIQRIRDAFIMQTMSICPDKNYSQLLNEFNKMYPAPSFLKDVL